MMSEFTSDSVCPELSAKNGPAALPESGPTHAQTTIRVTRNNEKLRGKSDISGVIFEEHLVTLRTFSTWAAVDSELRAGLFRGSL
jgi:hypothetical protein